MKVYELIPNSREYHDFALANGESRQVFARFDGRPLRSDWAPPAVTAADEDDELARFADYALLGTIPVFSSGAVAALRSLLEPNGELLPLKYGRGSFFAYNTTRFLDALNETESVMTRLSSGRVMLVERFVFRREPLDGEAIFKIPQLPRAFVFVTDTFVVATRAAGLLGFSFRLLWTSDGR